MKFHHSIFRPILDHSQVSLKIIQRHVHSSLFHFETASYNTSHKDFQKKNRELKTSSTTSNYSFTFIHFIILFSQSIDHLAYITILLYSQDSYNAFRSHQLFFSCFNFVLSSWFNWSSWWLIDRRSLNLLFSMMIYECESFILSWFVSIHESVYEIFQIFSSFFFQNFFKYSWIMTNSLSDTCSVFATFSTLSQKFSIAKVFVLRCSSMFSRFFP